MTCLERRLLNDRIAGLEAELVAMTAHLGESHETNKALVETIERLTKERDIALFWLGRETFRPPTAAVRNYYTRGGPDPLDKSPEYYRALGREKAGLPADPDAAPATPADRTQGGEDAR